MPKPVIHRIHLRACAKIDFLITQTYRDYVYFSEKENQFFVSESGCNKEGYMKVNSLRQYWKNATEFDNWLKGKIEMRPEAHEYEDHLLWADFKKKFKLTEALFSYAPFFERILYRVCKDYSNELVTVMEFKHTFGGLYDENGNTLSLKQELAIIQKTERNIQQIMPLIQIRIIV